jgi:hypothetical protein
MARRTILFTIALATACTAHCSAQTPWREKLQQELPLLGHRNWIVIADSAYPLQTAPGIETIYTDAGQLEVLKAAIEELDKAPHVRPIIYTDAELKHVAEADARGISAYRDGLSAVIGKREVQSLPHEQIISKLDEAGKTFRVLILKTKLTIPYTSVFLQLDCGYWSAAAEQRLRTAIKAAEPAPPRAK